MTILTKKIELKKLILKGISQEDLDNNYDYSQITDMSYMFDGCYSLKKIPFLNTSNVTNMQNIFYNCSSLKSIPLLDNELAELEIKRNDLLQKLNYYIFNIENFKKHISSLSLKIKKLLAKVS